MSTSENPSIPEDDLEALLRAVEAPDAPRKSAKAVPERMVGFRAAFAAWLAEFDIKQGRKESITSSDFYRHFAQWAETNAPGVGAVGGNVWGRAMRALGIPRGRKVIDGRDSRPYLLGPNAAAYFVAWLRENPPPPVGQDPFTVIRRPKAAQGAP
jgi:hypothetical protein